MPRSLAAILFWVIFFSQDLYCAGGKHGHSLDSFDPTTSNPDINTNSNSNSHEGRNMNPRNNRTPTTSQTITLNQYQNYPTNQLQNYPTNQMLNYSTNQQINNPMNQQLNNPMNQHQNNPMNHQQRSMMNQHQNYPTNQMLNYSTNQQLNYPLNQQLNNPMNQHQNNPMNHQQRSMMNKHQNNPMNQYQNNSMNKYLGNQVTYQQTYPVNHQQNNLVNEQQRSRMNSQQNNLMNHQQRSQMNNHQNNPMNQHQNNPMNQHQNNSMNQYLGNQVTYQQTYPVNHQQNNLMNHQRRSQMNNQQNNPMNQQLNNSMNQYLGNQVTQQQTYPVNQQQNNVMKNQQNNLVNHNQDNQLNNQQNNQMNQLHLDHTDMVISCSSLNLIPPDPNMIPTGIDTSSVSHCNGTKAYKTCPIKCRKGYGPVRGGIEAVCRQNGTWVFCHGGMCIPTEIVTTGFIRQTHEAKHNAYIPDSLRDIIQDFYAPVEDEVIFSLTAKPLESDTLEALKAFLSTDKPSDGELYLQRVNSELGDGNTDAEYYCSVDMEMSSDDNMTHILFTLSNWYYEDYEENFILGEIANSIRNNVSFSWNTNHENLPALRTFMENVQEITLYFWNNSVQMAKHTDDSGNDCSIEAFRYSNSGNVYLAFDPIK